MLGPSHGKAATDRPIERGWLPRGIWVLLWPSMASLAFSSLSGCFKDLMADMPALVTLGYCFS